MGLISLLMQRVKSADILWNGIPSTSNKIHNVGSAGNFSIICTLNSADTTGNCTVKVTDSSGKSAAATLMILAQSAQVNTTPTTAQVITTPSNSTGGSSLSNLVNKAANIPYYSCQVNMTSGGTTENMTEWVETGNPGKVRMEITVAGQTSDVIFDGQNYYMYMPSLNMAYEMSAASAQQYAANSASSITQYNPVSLGSATVNGMDCSVYQYTVQGVSAKIWIIESIRSTRGDGFRHDNRCV